MPEEAQACHVGVRKITERRVQREGAKPAEAAKQGVPPAVKPSYPALRAEVNAPERTRKQSQRQERKGGSFQFIVGSLQICRALKNATE